jgi:N-acetylmuramoyl-L-alanine amidase
MSAFIFTVLVISAAVLLLAAEDETAITSCSDIVMVTRAEWGARASCQAPVKIPVPVNMTFIHHSAGSRSSSPAECIKIVRGIQNFHMDDRGWNDIGYSFLVCEDGRVYEGRGWNVEGAHTLGYNTIALGICIIGDFTKDLPLTVAVTTVKNLIQCGIDKGFIVPHYELFGHRDGRIGTDCPGDALYALIRTWPNYSTRHIHKYGTRSTTSNASSLGNNKPPHVMLQRASEEQRGADKL